MRRCAVGSEIVVKIIRRFGRNRMALCRPITQINQFAALRTEWPERALRAPRHLGMAVRAFHDSGIRHGILSSLGAGKAQVLLVQLVKLAVQGVQGTVVNYHVMGAGLALAACHLGGDDRLHLTGRHLIA